jgi:hypothetical protein
MYQVTWQRHQPLQTRPKDNSPRPPNQLFYIWKFNENQKTPDNWNRSTKQKVTLTLITTHKSHPNT